MRSATMNRRGVLRGRRGGAITALAVTAVLAAACGGATTTNGTSVAGGGNGPIPVGSLLDETGPLDIYGTDMAAATQLAVEDINSHGGVLGRQLKLISRDTQSNNSEYTQFANQLILQDHVAVLMGGVTSASREAIRPIADRYKTVYFYNEQYEGGVCDKNTFLTGVVPSQQLAALVAYTIKHFGPNLYVPAADYNYGHISATWVARYAQKDGGRVVKTTFVPLTDSNFSSVISDLEATHPSAVVSLLVGGDHIAFYRAFAAAGLGSAIKVVSPTFGLGNEQVVLSPQEDKGITVAYPYFQTLNNPANTAFKALWSKSFGSTYPDITDSAVTVWNGWHLWAKAVNKAGSLDHSRVIKALESGITFNSPSGTVTMNGPSHHLVQDVSIGVTNAQHGFTVLKTVPNVPPSYEEQVCNLVAHPNTNQQFVPNG